MRALATISLGALLAAGCQDNLTPQPADDVLPPGNCLPDRDGELTAAELPIALDGAATYYQSPAGTTRTVDLAGTGSVWDLTEEYPDDDLIEVGAAPLGDQWYAADVGAGQLVVDFGDGIDAVYHLDDLGLHLHALASREPDPPGGRTLLVYDAPVLVLRLPLRDGAAWTDTGTISAGTLDGLPYVGTDTYQVEVDGEGRLDLPYLRFSPALRVRTHVEVAPAAGGVTTSRRKTSFLFECFGEIASADSRADEPDPDFTTAASLRRFAL